MLLNDDDLPPLSLWQRIFIITAVFGGIGWILYMVVEALKKLNG